MNKVELAQAIGDKLGMNRGEVEKVINAFVDVVTEQLKVGNEVNITSFGSFSVSERSARSGVNPQNPIEKIEIPATRVPKFRAGKGLKESVRAV